MGLADPVIIFIASLSIGALTIHFSTRTILREGDFEKATRTALIGAFVWTGFGFLFGWYSLLGATIVLFIYIGLINYRYSNGWLTAITIALVTWDVTVGFLYLLVLGDLVGFEAVGFPSP